MPNYSKELSLATELVRNAAKITEWFRKKGFESYQKQNRSPVTLADFASQIFIISKLKTNFPQDQLIAEEDDSAFIDEKAERAINECYSILGLREIENFKRILNYRGVDSNRQWTIDPIDGTEGFLKNLSYTIGIGFMIDSDPKFSSIAAPNYNEKNLAVFSAEKGMGAKVSYDNGKFSIIRVSRQKVLKNAGICRSLHHDQPWTLKFTEIAGITKNIQMDGMGKFCLIADGSFDIFIRPERNTTNSWDYMPGDLIVREAGGRVTDLNGNHLKYEIDKCLLTSPGIIASNGFLHEETLKIIKENKLYD
jgi:3'(2'), 5'-bisphosphate nucleotidase